MQSASLFTLCREVASPEALESQTAWFPPICLTVPSVDPLFVDDRHRDAYHSWATTYRDAVRLSGHRPYLACLADAIVVGQNFPVLDRSGVFVEESCWNLPYAVEQSVERLPPDRFSSGELRVGRTLDEEVLLLGSPWAMTYYHWMVDSLPRLMLYRLLPGFERLKLLVPRLLPFHLETLERLGIGLERLLPFENECWRFRRLFVASPLHDHLGMSVEVVRWLREQFLPRHSGRLPKSARNPLYLSRRDAASRFLVNEAEVRALIARAGGLSIEGSQLRVADQAVLAADASILLAAHGAALTNMLFCSPGTPVVDLLPTGHISFVFHTLARALELPYLFLILPVQGERECMEAPLHILEALLASR